MGVGTVFCTIGVVIEGVLSTGSEDVVVIGVIVSCGIIRDDTITGDSTTIQSVLGIDGILSTEILGLRHIINHVTQPRIIISTTTPPIIIMSDEANIDDTVLVHSFCLNTRSRNPISSSPIFIPNVTFRRSDSVPPRAESSCIIMLIDNISHTFG
jgi:hypothetical protein